MLSRRVSMKIPYRHAVYSSYNLSLEIPLCESRRIAATLAGVYAAPGTAQGTLHPPAPGSSQNLTKILRFRNGLLIVKPPSPHLQCLSRRASVSYSAVASAAPQARVCCPPRRFVASIRGWRAAATSCCQREQRAYLRKCDQTREAVLRCNQALRRRSVSKPSSIHAS